MRTARSFAIPRLLHPVWKDYDWMIPMQKTKQHTGSAVWSRKGDMSWKIHLALRIQYNSFKIVETVISWLDEERNILFCFCRQWNKLQLWTNITGSYIQQIKEKAKCQQTSGCTVITNIVEEMESNITSYVIYIFANLCFCRTLQ